MDQRAIPSSRIAPLPPEHSPELSDQFEVDAEEPWIHSEQHPHHVDWIRIAAMTARM